ncbi:hybrid sensor histidine kinase/response regulator [Parasedimentitalea huanghaiensis]|uniref:histidine kinase n=1 Tax=Parasedimentitalea huanghaiensis TaxID=2682100 RepID=A0A6L6W8Y9_9RHOB|nr:ATP-binding protein [Zongyanglinia huanghaiensis]MVO14293.1 response regulator [Zongyanglinia huanghaiensis]
MRSVWGHSSRIWRAIAAIVIVGVLVGALLFLEHSARKAEAQQAYNLSSLTWKVSETLFESQRLQMAMLEYKDDPNSLDGLVLATEILWSRLGVIGDNAAIQHDGLSEIVAAYYDFMSRHETEIYEQTKITRDKIDEMIDELDVLSAALRKLWIGDFLHQHRVIIRAAVYDTSHDQELQKKLIVVCILILVSYLIGECLNAFQVASKERSLREQATSASAAKSAFIANVSHEIRTPLNGVIGMAQELSETSLKAEQKDQVDIILSSGELLLSTINDVLDLSKVESTEVTLEPRIFDPVKQLKQTVSLHKANARAKDLVLDFKIRGDFPSRASGDPMRLSQVINNLLSNAIKFTDKGRVHIQATCEEITGSDNFKLTVEVADTGPGIATASLRHVFQPFFQVDSTTTRRNSGTGLGLTISKTICRAMGGDLSVQSKTGVGSTFTADFCLSVAAEKGDVPSVSLFQPDTSTHPDVLGQTATSSRVKDLDDPAQKKNLRILLVDDSSTNRKIAKMFIEPRCCQISEAATGAQAVAAAATESFDVILMDIQMPEMDGVEATARIREHEKRKNRSPVPIFALTANVMTHQVKNYLDQGMNQVVAKPIRKVELLALLEAFPVQ